MLHMGMGLLDRKTGKLRYFAEGREDSLAMSVVAADGSIYVAHSPLRRAVGKAKFQVLLLDTYKMTQAFVHRYNLAERERPQPAAGEQPFEGDLAAGQVAFRKQVIAVAVGRHLVLGEDPCDTAECAGEPPPLVDAQNAAARR